MDQTRSKTIIVSTCVCTTERLLPAHPKGELYYKIDHSDLQYDSGHSSRLPLERGGTAVILTCRLGLCSISHRLTRLNEFSKRKCPFQVSYQLDWPLRVDVASVASCSISHIRLIVPSLTLLFTCSH
jgi:hypothetical protein